MEENSPCDDNINSTYRQGREVMQLIENISTKVSLSHVLLNENLHTNTIVDMGNISEILKFLTSIAPSTVQNEILLLQTQHYVKSCTSRLFKIPGPLIQIYQTLITTTEVCLY